MGECISYPRLPNMAPVKQAAQLYGLSPYYIRCLCKAGKIRFVNAGRGWLVNLDDPAPAEQCNSASSVRRVYASMR